MDFEGIESSLSIMSKDDLISHHSKIEALYQSNEGAPWIACADYFLSRYLNFDDVKEALHVDTSIAWAECSEKVFYNWPESDWDNSMEKMYDTLVNNYDIKIMIFSGDDDSVCAIQGTMYWMTRMGWDVVKLIKILTVCSLHVHLRCDILWIEKKCAPCTCMCVFMYVMCFKDEDNDWEPWTVSNQLAGFYRRYLKSDGSTAVHFQSVRSAGHMVPQTQPLRALELLYKYLYEI